MKLKINNLLIFFLLFISILQTFTINVKSLGYSQENIEWIGEEPTFVFNDLKNYSKTNNESIYVSWTWFDNWSAGFGYASILNIKVHDIDYVLLYENKTYINDDLYNVPCPEYAPISSFSKSVMLNFTQLNISKETEIIIDFEIQIITNYNSKYNNFFDYWNQKSITSTLILKYTDNINTNRIIDLKYIPYLIIGCVSLIFIITIKIKYDKNLNELRDDNYEN